MPDKVNLYDQVKGTCMMYDLFYERTVKGCKVREYMDGPLLYASTDVRQVQLFLKGYAAGYDCMQQIHYDEMAGEDL